jgi:hypothetical protein
MWAIVSARRVDEEGFASTTTDDDGRFALPELVAGTYELSAEGNGGPITVHPEVVTVKEGEPPTEVRLVVRARHRISGQVVDERGLPVAGASLEAALSPALEAWQSPAEHQTSSARAGDDGRFELDGLLPGSVRLTLDLGGAPLPIVAGEEEPVVPSDDPITLVVKLPAGRIEGRILGAGPGWHGASVELSGEAGELSLLQTLPIDEEGRFSALVPPDAEVSLQAVSDEGETAIAEHVRAGDRVALSVRPAATLRGTVHGASRLFRVDLQGSDIRSEVFLDTDGSFEMRGVPALSTAVTVSANGVVAREDITLSPGETRSLDLTLVPVEDVAEYDTMPEGDEGDETTGDEAIGEVTEETEGEGGAD